MKPLTKDEICEKPYETKYPNVLCRNCGQELKYHTMINKKVIDTSYWPTNIISNGILYSPKFTPYYKIIRTPKCPERPLHPTTANVRFAFYKMLTQIAKATSYIRKRCVK